MRRLDLDYQARRWPLPGLVLGAVGFIAALAAFFQFQSLDATAEQRQESLSRLEAGRQAGQRRLAARQRGGDTDREHLLRTATGIAKDIHRPWEALFAALEASASDDIALLTLTPDANRNTLRISGEAKRREAILAYVTRLGETRVLRNVVLIEDELQAQTPERPFRFLLTADWVAT